MLTITAAQRRALRARAHALNPVVMVSQNGLSESVLQEISASLDHHELIKIRIFSDDRTQRETYFSAICAQLNAAPIQHIGKLIVIFRPALESKSSAQTIKRRRAEPRRSKRSFQGSTQK